MILNMKRKRTLSEREEAVPQRERAARDFVAAIREAEAALDALKAANDRFYRSDDQAGQLALSDSGGRASACSSSLPRRTWSPRLRTSRVCWA